MKIAVTSSGSELISHMDPRFGRAKYFIIVDPKTLDYDVVENKQNIESAHEAGIQAANTVVDQKADVLISGNCGPKAYEVLKVAGRTVVTGAKGRVIDAIIQYKSGELQAADGPNVDEHWF